MNELKELQERIRAVLAVLAAWNDDFYGIGGAAGDLDAEQVAELEKVARQLENMAVEYGLYEQYENVKEFDDAQFVYLND